MLTSVVAMHPALVRERLGLSASRTLRNKSRRPSTSLSTCCNVKVRHEGRFVVVGLNAPLAGSCSLLLAARQRRRLVYVGRCEWGVSRSVVAALRERCVALTEPASEAAERGGGIVCVKPDVVVDVQYNELMQGRLRDLVLRAVEG